MRYMELKDNAQAAFGVLIILLIFWYVTGSYVFLILPAAISLAFLVDYYSVLSKRRAICNNIFIWRSFSRKLSLLSLPVSLSIILSNQGRSSLRLSVYQPLDSSFSSGPQPGPMDLMPGSNQAFNINIKPLKCGDFLLSPLKVSFNTWFFKDTLPLGEDVTLAVRIPIGQFLLRSNIAYRSHGKYAVAIGQFVEKGQGSDFSCVRKYMPGDNIKNIDWAISLRTGGLVVREYENERTLPSIFLIDIDASMDSREGVSELESAIKFASTLVDRLVMDNERTGLICFSRADVISYLNLGMGIGHLTKMRDMLSGIKPVKSSEQRRSASLSIKDLYEAGNNIDRAMGTRLIGPIIEETVKEYAANIKDDGFARAVMKAIQSSGGPCSMVVMTNLSMGMASLLNGIRLAGYYGHSVSVVLTPHIWLNEKELVDIEKSYEGYTEIKDAITRLKARSIKVTDLGLDEMPEDILYGARIKNRVSNIRG